VELDRQSAFIPFFSVFAEWSFPTQAQVNEQTKIRTFSHPNSLYHHQDQIND